MHPRVFAVAGLAVACVSDHDALVRRDDPPAAGGAPDASDGGGGSTSDAEPRDGSDAEMGEAGASEAAADGAREPDGTDRLTLFHGVVDAPRVAFCVIRQPDGGSAVPVEPLLPPSGLEYATPLVAPVPAGIDFTTDAVRFIVVAGDAPALAATSCAEALSMAEPGAADAAAVPDAAVPDAAVPDAAASDGGASQSLRAGTLPLLPAPTLARGRSLLLAATGCLGATAHDAPAREAICGAGDRATLGMVLAPMSRLTSRGRLGLQALHASRATDGVGVVSLPPPDSATEAFFVASDLVHGQIAPRFANTDRAKFAYGMPLEAAQIDVRRRSQAGSVSVPWGEALVRGGVASVDDGTNYTIVFAGPLIGSSAEWANPSTVTIVPSDPP